MITIEAAITRVQSTEFTVVAVQHSAITNNATATDLINQMCAYFPGRPIVLAARTGSGIEYRGHRRDIVNWLAANPTATLPWKRYTFSQTEL